MCERETQSDIVSLSAIMLEQEIFTAALIYSDTAERSRYLDEVCGADRDLRQRLNELLQFHQSSDTVLDRQAIELVVSLETSGEMTETNRKYSEAATLQQLKPLLAEPTLPDSIGRLGHYELLQILGQGGYGIVARAIDTKLERQVAIKILSPHLAVTSPPRKRFAREARASAAVRDENVVQIYAVEESPIPHLVMEFVAGESLQERIDRLGPFEPDEVVRLGQQIALGLAAAHQQGLVHRDIKPGNILLESGFETQVKLTDFGLAQTADDASLTQSGVIAGTPQYMSPEQVLGKDLDQRADLFSLGSVLYVMTVGHPPFRAPNTMAVLKRVAEDTPRPIRQIMPEVPRGLSNVIARLHEKSKERRFSTAQEVADALAVCLIEKPTHWPVSKRATAAAIGLLMIVALGLVAGMSPFDKPSVVAQSESSSSLNSVQTVATAEQQSAENSPEVTSPILDGDKVAAATVPQPTPSSIEAVNPELTEWDRAVIAMPVEQQEKAVRGKLVELNPELPDSAIQLTLTERKITDCRIDPSRHLSNLAPLRALRDLQTLRLDTGGLVEDLRPLSTLKLKQLVINAHPIRDLSPLAGVPLTEIAQWQWPGDDLSPLRGMKLTYANVGGSNVSDISPLRGMPLTGLCINYSQVGDLSPLEGMPLTQLETQNNRVWDLKPIAKAPLERLWTQGSLVVDYDPIKNMATVTDLTLNYDAERDDSVLRTLKSLTTVNKMPVANVLK